MEIGVFTHGPTALPPYRPTAYFDLAVLAQKAEPFGKLSVAVRFLHYVPRTGRG
jgi:hypothetical protein